MLKKLAWFSDHESPAFLPSALSILCKGLQAPAPRRRGPEPERIPRPDKQAERQTARVSPRLSSLAVAPSLRGGRAPGSGFVRRGTADGRTAVHAVYRRPRAAEDRARSGGALQPPQPSGRAVFHSDRPFEPGWRIEGLPAASAEHAGDAGAAPGAV